MPRGASAASRANLDPAAKRARTLARKQATLAKNVAGKPNNLGGFDDSEVQRARNAKGRERRATDEEVGELIARGDPAGLTRIVAEMGTYIYFKLRSERLGHKELDPAVTARNESLRKTAEALTVLRRELQSDTPAELISAEIVKRLLEANYSEWSPEVTYEQEDTPLEEVDTDGQGPAAVETGTDTLEPSEAPEPIRFASI